jgi:hypothetical protein
VVGLRIGFWEEGFLLDAEKEEAFGVMNEVITHLSRLLLTETDRGCEKNSFLYIRKRGVPGEEGV